MFANSLQSGWEKNSSFTELSPEKAKDSINEKMRKDLKAAFELAAEGNSVEHYKNMLREMTVNSDETLTDCQKISEQHKEVELSASLLRHELGLFRAQ